MAGFASASPRRVSLIGAPTDLGASQIGCRLGPGALRVAGLSAALSKFGCEVLDGGDLSGPENPMAAPVGGWRHLPEVVAWNQSIYRATTEVLQAGRLPMLLGGDHAFAIGSLHAVAQHCRQHGRAPRVLWLDAHADCNTATITPSGNLHGMPVACLCGEGPASLVDLSGTGQVALQTSQLRLIGLRSVDEDEKAMLRHMNLSVYDMRYIDEWGMRATLEAALADLQPDEHVHVSLDLDFLDPGIAPGVGTPVQGGPTYREAQLCMEMIADTGRLGSVDIVELNPALDLRNQSALLAVDLVESLFGKSTLLRR